MLTVGLLVRTGRTHRRSARWSEGCPARVAASARAPRSARRFLPAPVLAGTSADWPTCTLQAPVPEFSQGCKVRRDAGRGEPQKARMLPSGTAQQVWPGSGLTLKPHHLGAGNQPHDRSQPRRRACPAYTLDAELLITCISSGVPSPVLRFFFSPYSRKHAVSSW